MSVHDKLEAAERAVADLRAAVEEQDEATSAPTSGIEASPEVRQAAETLARAIARAQGVDLPLQMAEGVSFPVMELPEEFQRFGGVGIGVMVAPPTEAARQA